MSFKRYRICSLLLASEAAWLSPPGLLSSSGRCLEREARYLPKAETLAGYGMMDDRSHTLHVLQAFQSTWNVHFASAEEVSSNLDISGCTARDHCIQDLMKIIDRIARKYNLFRPK